MTGITTLFDSVPFAILILIILIVLLRYKQITEATMMILCSGAGACIMKTAKHFIHRYRPTDIPLIVETGYSFPSGHATMSTIFFLLIYYFFKDKFKDGRQRIIFLCANFVAIFLVSFSRVYLGVHWLSDVISGFLLGLFCATTTIYIYKIILKRKIVV